MGYAHQLALREARIQGTCDFLDKQGISYSHNDVFKFFGTSRSTGWRILRQPRNQDARERHSVENRGRKKKLTAEMVAQIEKFIEDNGFDGRTITWAGLPAAAGVDVDVHGETVRRALKHLNLQTCNACEKKCRGSSGLREHQKNCLARSDHGTRMVNNNSNNNNNNNNTTNTNNTASNNRDMLQHIANEGSTLVYDHGYAQAEFIVNQDAVAYATGGHVSHGP
ncbi:hypothetical protein N658DRAFT_496456 [Parathielavia hyrcaniae]|uniref:Uncharacterized protein n=1 Tax=Parathielavia hyrcaniae TaxID=113614 RepID=A0AAN6Q2Q4_9PEZI|nr:hypothetical protein N658DRAFT_496456 [Parathielavia hyrcaniae]